MTIYINAKNVIAGEKDGYVDFVITLSEASQTPVTVDYDTWSSSASYSDFTNLYGKLVFAPGVTTQTVRVGITDDIYPEQLENFTLKLSNPTNAVVVNPNTIATIVDNDTLADSLHRANISVRDVVVDASANVATFSVVLDKATNDSFSVAYNTVNGTATAGSDYVAGSGILTFGAGETAKTVSVALPHDGNAEPAELFNLFLGAVSGNAANSVVIADGSGQATIGAHGQTPLATPLINANNLFVGEKDGYADFIVTLSAPSQNQVTVNYETWSGSASYSDFSNMGGTLVFAPGVTTQTVRVMLTDDTYVEQLENFTLKLTSPTNAVIANPLATATIVDNDTLADTVNRAYLSVRDVVVDASADIATFSVVLDKATNDSFSVAYNTVNGTATAGSDYIANSGVLTFGAGETVKTVSVALPHDGNAEPAELFNLVLGAVSGTAANSVVIADGSGQATIGAHGQTPLAAPSINANNLFVGEKDGYADFIVTLSAPSQNQVTVNYETWSGSASYFDFANMGGTLVFAPGVTTQTVRVMLTDDTYVEQLENFTLKLTSPTNAVIANPLATATIVDNDTLADTVNRAYLSVRDVVVDASADIATFSVVLDKATNDSFSVAYNTVNGTATAGSDYIANSGVLTFGAGETAKTVSVALPHDGSAEPAELFKLVLGAVSGNAATSVGIADGSGQATIGAHGQTPLAAPSMNINNPFASEKDGYVDFLVTLSAPSQNQVTVNYETWSGTASYSDFANMAGKLVFAPGVTTQTVRVGITSDTITEPQENFTLRLTNPTNAVVSNGVGTASIVDGSSQTQVNGTAGLDTVTFNGPRENYTINKTAEGYTVADNSGATAAQLLIDVERIHFSNMNIGLDIDGIGGQAYRIYQAAFNRAPDAAGLGYWINTMDKGASLTQVAAGFMQSAEFIKAYGANPNNHDFVSQVYMNVLHRPAEEAGLNYWVNVLDTHQITQAQALSFISESAENQATLLPIIGNGFPYVPYG